MSRQESFPNDLWSTQPFRSCTTDAKFVFVWSRCNAACGLAGVYRFAVEQISLDTGMTPARVRAALAELEERRMVYCRDFEDDAWLWSVKRVADYWSKSAGTATGIARDIAKVPGDLPLRTAFLSYYWERRFGFRPPTALRDALVRELGADARPAPLDLDKIDNLLQLPVAAPVLLPAVADAPSKSEAREVFDAWIEAAGKTGKMAFEGDREKLIRRWLGTYPKEDLIDAVRGWRHSPHHRGENDRGTVYDDLSLLLRNPANIERFRDLERRARAGTRESRAFSEAELRAARSAAA